LLLFGSRDPVNCSVRIQVCATGEGKKTLCIFSSIHYSLCPGISDLQPRQCTCQIMHSDLPDTDCGRGHEKGWNYFLDVFREQFGNGSRKKFRWDEAHSPVEK
jgi:hypothetical protein